jgi:hypothetical protein
MDLAEHAAPRSAASEDLLQAPGGDDAVARWATLAADWGFKSFLSPEDGFRTCLASAGRWSGAKEPGIYFWLASDGQAYVGQSVNPQQRLREHLRTHFDIIAASYLPCPLARLDIREAELVRQAGQHYPLRNIKLAVSTSRTVPFDRIVDEEERERFLLGGALQDEPQRPLELLARLQARKFGRFIAMPGAEQALRALQTFVERAIPKPAATEAAFWSVTLLPKNHLLRLNVGQQEVFTFAAGEVRVFTDKSIGLLRSRRSRYAVESYETVLDPAALENWLTGKHLLACRRLLVRLMRHTTALNSGSHCPQAVRWDPIVHPLHEEVP